MFYYRVNEYQLIAYGVEGEVLKLTATAIEAHQVARFTKYGSKLVHNATVHTAIVMLSALSDSGELKFLNRVVIEQVIDSKSEARLKGC
jgi:hypothetical protein